MPGFSLYAYTSDCWGIYLMLESRGQRGPTHCGVFIGGHLQDHLPKTHKHIRADLPPLPAVFLQILIVFNQIGYLGAVGAIHTDMNGFSAEGIHIDPGREVRPQLAQGEQKKTDLFLCTIIAPDHFFTAPASHSDSGNHMGTNISQRLPVTAPGKQEDEKK